MLIISVVVVALGSMFFVFAGNTWFAWLGITYLAGTGIKLAVDLEKAREAKDYLQDPLFRKVIRSMLETTVLHLESPINLYGMKDAQKSEGFWDQVHMLPILSLLVREYCPEDARSTVLAQRGEALYDACTRRQVAA